MRIVTVARTPCVSSRTTANVVEHQAGALSIDACRIRFTSAEDRGTYEANAAGDRGHEDNRKRELGFKMGCGHAHDVGRWPPNAVFVHRPSCKIVGTRKVSTGTAHREKSGGRTVFSETEKPPMANMSYADADGKETVGAWNCEPGCPVAELDRQSGTLTSGSGTVKRANSAARGGKVSAIYGDTGSASRFFKAVGAEGSEG